MGRARDDTPLASAIAALYNNIHYLGAIAQMASRREVLVTQSVYAEDGQLLFDKGSLLGADLLERLGTHRLQSPLEGHLLVAEAADIGALHVDMARLLSSDRLGQLMAADLGPDAAMLGRALRHMVWPQQASFQMTVVREQLPSLYAHSLLMTGVALWLAIRAGWDEAQCARLAPAALLHDVGMLYMSSSWVNAAYKLNERERAQLAAHSITGSRVVQSMQAYDFNVEDAVLEHHERLDGSGYPRQLSAEAISPMGRILMVAEVVSAFFDKYTDMANERLSLMLRLNARRFPADAVAAVLALLQQETRPAPAMSQDAVLRDCLAVATVFQYWASCKKVLPAQWQGLPGSRALMWVDARMRALEVSLAESGAHARSQAEWRAILAQMPESVAELGLIHREVLWQIDSCMHSCQRRWPPNTNDPSLVERALWTWIHSSRKTLHPALAPEPGPADTAAPHSV